MLTVASLHQAQGKWLVSFYVGVPVFDDDPVKAPAAYPLEKEGKPDPADTLEVTINGISQVSLSPFPPASPRFAAGVTGLTTVGGAV
jgi:hypothetical protein